MKFSFLRTSSLRVESVRLSRETALFLGVLGLCVLCLFVFLVDGILFLRTYRESKEEIQGVISHRAFKESDFEETISLFDSRAEKFEEILKGYQTRVHPPLPNAPKK